MRSDHGELLPYEIPPAKGEEVQITSYLDGGVRVVVRPSRKWRQASMITGALFVIGAVCLIAVSLSYPPNRMQLPILMIILFSAMTVAVVVDVVRNVACVLLRGDPPNTIGISPDRVVVNIDVWRAAQAPRRALRTITLLRNASKD